MKDALAKYKSKVVAVVKTIRHLLSLLENDKHPADGIEAQRPQLGEVSIAVRGVVKAMNGEFNVTDVSKELVATGFRFKRSSIRAAIRRMVTMEIELVTQGKGRRPASYIKRK